MSSAPDRSGSAGARSLRDTVLYFLTIAAGQGISFVLLPILTKYFTPTAYGEYAVALAVSGFIGTLGSSWVRNVGFRLFFEARRAGRTGPFFVTIAAGQAAIVAILFGMVAAAGAFVPRMPAVPAAVLLAAAASVITGDFLALTVSLLRAEQKAGHYAVAEIGTAAVRFAATVVGLVLGARSSTLLFLATAGGASMAAVYALRALRPVLGGGTALEPRLFREVARYAPAALPFSVGVWVERMIDRLVLDHYLTRDVVGVYSANYTLVERVIGGLVLAVFMMAWPDILRSWNEGGKAAAREASTRAAALFFWVTFGPAVFVAVFSAQFAVVLGPAYRSGTEIMPYVAAAAWLGGFRSYLNRQFELQLRFATVSAVTIAGAALNFTLNVVLVPRLGMHGAALATLGNYAATTAIFWVIRDREFVRLPIREIAAVLLVAALALAASMLPEAGMKRAIVFALVYSAGAGAFLFGELRGRVATRTPPRESGATSTGPAA